MQTVLQILDNTVFLCVLGLGYFIVQRNAERLGNPGLNVAQGLVFGLVAFLVTAAPVTLGDGATVDARAGPVILAGIVSGPIGGAIAAGLGALSRGLVGGSFAPSGMIVFVLYALIGIGLARTPLFKARPILPLSGVLVLIVASWAAATSMFAIIRPLERAFQWLQFDLPFILLANALAIGLAAFMIQFAHAFLRKTEEVVHLSETLGIAKRAGKFGVWDFDVASGTLSWDSRSKELHGVSEEAFEGRYRDWARTVLAEDLADTETAFAMALKDPNADFDVEYRVALPKGGTRSIKGDGIVLRDYSGDPVRVVGTNLDLTELRSAEAALTEAKTIAAKSQKVETIGQLTGGVAHDFNNLLAVILGNQELLKTELGKDPVNRVESLALIDESISASLRGADLTRNMLAYARKAQLTPVKVDLNEVVRETDNWLRRMIEKSVEIEIVLQAGLWPTQLDRSSVQSALVNLLVNARDALEGQGKVTVETANVRIDREYIKARDEDIAPGRYVMLAVTDTGPGIPEEKRTRIFDPFFTTKATGKGSGLGLSMVQGFAKQSDGAIRVYSEVGVGTSFKLYFPAHQVPDDAVTNLTTPTDMNARDAPGKARLLVVEDESSVLLVLHKTLQGAGYDVVTAMTGDEALERFKADGGIDLVVTDIVMPGKIQGPELAKQIRQITPDMGFIFLSGYASEATVHGNGLRASDIRLMKPVSQQSLINAVEVALTTDA